MDDKTLGDLLGLIVPDFGQLWRGELSGINALVVLILLAIFVTFVGYVGAVAYRSVMRVREFNELIQDLDPTQLAAHRQRLLTASGDSRDAAVKHIWREFDETLVESPDGETLWNTLDAEEFFDSRSLAASLTHNRLLTAVPSILTAIGVLGTFIGLTTGLNGLEVGTNSDVEQLKVGIDTLIAGAAIAFMTSVWGVFLSLLGNAFEKTIERQVLRKVTQLQQSIDRTFKRHPPEQSLISIMGSSLESEKALQELHERIGNQLQEAVAGLSHDLELALTKAIESAMTPAMSTLIDSTSQQSTAVFEKLVDQFSEGFRSIGDTQAQKLEDASTGISDALASMAGDFTSVMEKIEASSVEQQEQLASRSERFQEDLAELARLNAEMRDAMSDALHGIISELKDAAKQVAESGSNLGRAAVDLDSASSTMQVAAESLGTKFQVSVEKVEALAEQQEGAASLFWEYAEQLKSLQATMTSTSENMASAATASGEGFVALEKHQNSFLRELRESFAETSKAHLTRVEELNKSMDEWLADYSQEVSSQVTSRMDEWNTQSLSYAENMLRVAKALSDTVDEIEVKR